MSNAVLTALNSGRRARVDQLAIDHCRGGVYLPRWSSEAERFEPRFAALRARLTVRDRIEAWRRLFARYGAHPHD